MAPTMQSIICIVLATFIVSSAHDLGHYSRLLNKDRAKPLVLVLDKEAIQEELAHHYLSRSSEDEAEHHRNDLHKLLKLGQAQKKWAPFMKPRYPSRHDPKIYETLKKSSSLDRIIKDWSDKNRDQVTYREKRHKDKSNRHRHHSRHHDREQSRYHQDRYRDDYRQQNRQSNRDKNDRHSYRSIYRQDEQPDRSDRQYRYQNDRQDDRYESQGRQGRDQEERSLRSPIVKSLLRISNSLRCGANQECQQECDNKSEDRCKQECDIKYECEEEEENDCDGGNECADSQEDERTSTKGELYM